MKINEMLKQFIKEHQSKINIFRFALTSGITSLLYSEYIKNIKQQQIPSRIIWLPKLSTITEILTPQSHLAELISEQLIDRIIEDKIFKKYTDIPELIIFNEENDNIELLKSILDINIIPYIGGDITTAISKKFGLANPDNKLIKESRDIDLFDRDPINDMQFKFIVDETVLQLLILLPSIKKKEDFPEDNTRIQFAHDEILTVNHENALCPIHFNSEIIQNHVAMDLLSFVTNTIFRDCRVDENKAVRKDGVTVDYVAVSNPFNRTMITKLL